MRPRVLVVDDSLTVRMDLRTALSTAGFLVTTCGTIESAQSWLASHSFALAILDVLLPDGSGISLLKQIRESAKLQSTAVIVLSKMSEVSSRVHGLRLGADHYIGKPYDRDSFVRVAKELLQRTPASAMSSSTREVNNKKKLLVVDDSPTFINSLAAVLRKDGYEVVMAYSGEEAIELLTVQIFDGLLIDLVLPGIDGIETCRRLRAKTGMDQTSIIVMTASENPGTRTRALAAGADELSIKSADFRMLTTQLLCLLVTKRQSSSRAEPAGLPALDGPGMSKAGLLYQHVLAASGLSALIAKPLVDRIFARLGIDPALITPADLAHALDEIHKTLRTFLPASELDKRMVQMAALTRPLLSSDAAAESSQRFHGAAAK